MHSEEVISRYDFVSISQTQIENLRDKYFKKWFLTVLSEIQEEEVSFVLEYSKFVFFIMNFYHPIQKTDFETWIFRSENDKINEQKLKGQYSLLSLRLLKCFI